MKCPKCGNVRCEYNISRKEKKFHSRKETVNERKRRRNTKTATRDPLPPRTDFNASCKCGFKGVV